MTVSPKRLTTTVVTQEKQWLTLAQREQNHTTKRRKSGRKIRKKEPFIILPNVSKLFKRLSVFEYLYILSNFFHSDQKHVCTLYVEINMKLR